MGSQPVGLEADELRRYALVVKTQDRLGGDDRAGLIDARLTRQLAPVPPAGRADRP